MTWLKLPLQIGTYKIERMKQARAKVEIFTHCHLGDFPFYLHDPKGMIKNFFQKHNLCKDYTHETWVHEEDYTSWQEVETKLWKKQKVPQNTRKFEDVRHEEIAHEDVEGQVTKEKEEE